MVGGAQQQQQQQVVAVINVNTDIIMPRSAAERAVACTCAIAADKAVASAM